MTQPKPMRETGLRFGYIRVSDPKQAKKYSPAQQKKAIELAAPGPIDRWFEDHETGTRDDRKNFLIMQELVAKGGVAEVWVLCLDRFARDEYDALRISRDFRKAGTKLLFVEGQTDTETPEGRLQFGIQAVFAAHVSAKIRQTSMEKREYKMRETKRPDSWHLPLGFDVIDDYPQINEERAELARQIFQWRYERKSLYRICGLLEQMGAKPQRKEHWGESTMRRLLSASRRVDGSYGPNRSYIGEYHRCGQIWPVLDKTGKLLTIIDRKIFDEVERMKDAIPQELVGRPVVEPFLLHQWAWCGQPGCGKRMQCVVEGGKYRFYRCRGNIRSKAAFAPPCVSSRCQAQLLEDMVWREIWAILREPERLRKLALAFVNDQLEAANLADDPYQQMAALEAKRARILFQHEEKYLTDQQLKAKMAVLQRKMGLLEMAIRALPQVIPIAPLSLVEQMCAEIAGGEEPDDYEGRRDVLRHLRDMRVTVVAKQYAKITAKLPVDSAAAPISKKNPAHRLAGVRDSFAPIPFEINVRLVA